jgi:hypothetical protein
VPAFYIRLIQSLVVVVQEIHCIQQGGNYCQL